MATEPTRTVDRKLNRLYRNRGEAEATKKLSGNVQFVILETISGGHRVEADLFRLFPEGQVPEPCMAFAGLAFGMNTVLGNEIAGKDASDPLALATMMRERLDAIYDGEWSEGRQGPRLRHVLEAWAADARERGKTVTAESIEKMRQKIEAGDTSTKDLLNNPAINAWYQKHKADRAIAEFEKAKAAAAAAGTTGSQFDPE
jgi:hypothetical protein